MQMKNFVLGIAIMILTISVVVQGVGIFYDSPDYDDFCASSIYPKPIDNQTVCPAVCVELYEIENGECVFNPCGSGCGADGATTFETLEQCEIVLSGKNCYNVYQESRENYSKNLFLITFPLGIIILAVGAIFFGLEVVGAGLMGGGVGVILWGVGSFWEYAGNLLKFVLSLVGLVAVIYVAYYFNKKFDKKKKKG